MSTPAHTGAPLGGDPVNDPKDRNPKKSRSKFDLSYKFATTLRFGEISPFLYIPCVPDSKKTVRSSHLLRSFSLESPLLQNLRIKKDFIAIPKRALLPRTWDLIYTNPTRGEDIDALMANTIMPANELSQAVSRFDNGYFDQNYQAITVPDANDVYSGTGVFQSVFMITLHRLVMVNSLFAKDSLFSTFRMPLSIKGTTMNGIEIDSNKYLSDHWEYFHTLCDALGSLDSTIRVVYGSGPVRFYTLGSGTSADPRNLTDRMRLFYDYIEDPSITGIFSMANSVTSAGVANLNNAISTVFGLVSGQVSHETLAYFANKYDPFISSSARKVNWSPLLAYLLACVEFHTNDHVDDLYSVDLVRNMYDTYGGGVQYSVNGISGRYDAFSYVNLQAFLTNLPQIYNPGESWFTYVPYMAHMISALYALITRRRSLRFIDYFSGSRPQPLAVFKAGTLSDVEATVNNNKVSAIDITKSIQAQRFLNQINHVGRRAKDYLKGLFGVEPMERTDVPVLLGTVTESIYGIETQNTADAQTQEQNSITTNFQSSANNFAFEFSSREESIVIGVCYFDIERFYDRGFTRFASEVDRYDMYNPYFQFIGDQPLYLREYDSTGLQNVMDDTAVFGYTSRDQQRKTFTDYCTGDFVGDVSLLTNLQNVGTLRTWVFKQQYEISSPHIGPDFIRANQTELDRYYISHTGDNSADRYNFICLFTNHIDASEPMAFNPQILG